MPILGGIFSKKDKQQRPGKNSSPGRATAGSTLRIVDDGRSSSPSSRVSSIATDYILPEISLNTSGNGTFDDASSSFSTPSSRNMYTNPNASASSSMLRLVNPFRRRSPSGDGHQVPSVPSSPLRSENTEELLPPLRNSIFNSIDGNTSSQSLPTDIPVRSAEQPIPQRPTPVTSRTLPIPKTPEIRTSTNVKVFNHNAKPSHSSKPSEPKVSLPPAEDSSFTLKAFRQVRPESPVLQPPSFPASTVGAGPRPRGGSNASDVSQKITVAAFREAQMRSRSSTHIPDSASDGMPPGNVPLAAPNARPASPAGSFNTPPRPSRQLPPSSFGRNSPTPSASATSARNASPAAPRNQSRLSNHRWAVNSSDEDTSSEDEDDERNATITAAGRKLGRGDTITQRDANANANAASRANARGVNEIGTRPRPNQASSGSSGDSSSKAKSDLGHGGFGHSRKPSQEQQRPMAARSELGHEMPIPRAIPPGTTPPSSFSRGSFASALDMPKSRPALKNGNGRLAADSETSESESSESSDDDAPLSTLLPPRRPGSAMSSVRSSSPAGSTRSAPGLPPSNSSPLVKNRLSPTTPKGSHLRTTSASAITTLEAPARGRQPLVDLAAPMQKETGKPVQPPAPTKKTGSAPLRSKRSFKDVQAPTSTNTSSPVVHVRQPSSSNTAETITRGRSSTLQVDQLPSVKSQSQYPSPSPSPKKESESTPRFMVPRPFTRTDSPASSIGNSSGSGILPLTPQTGSEAGASIDGSSVSGDGPRPEKRRVSVSFVEPEAERKGKGQRREPSDGASDKDPAEDKRKERRRSEAKAAIELGKVVNGPAPVVEPEESQQPFNAGAMSMPINQNAMGGWDMMQMQQFLQTPQMQPQLGGMPALNMNMMGATPGMPQFNFTNPMMNNMGGMGMSTLGVPGFGLPQIPPMPPMPAMGGAMDPSMMMAHQQAMFMAKQAYQLAVAQQAMLAAGDEWERASHAGGFSGGGLSPFPAPPASMYAGSALGVPTGSVWGGSAYGGRGPGSTLGYSFPTAGTEIGGPTSGKNPGGRNTSGVPTGPSQPRQRTKTAPSSSQPPAHLRGAGAPPLPPPSSWKPSR